MGSNNCKRSVFRHSRGDWFEGDTRYTKPIYVVLLCEVYREKSLRHVVMVAKFWMTTNQKFT